MTDREFWLAFYRALIMICKAIKKRHLGGKVTDENN